MYNLKQPSYKVVSAMLQFYIPYTQKFSWYIIFTDFTVNQVTAKIYSTKIVDIVKQILRAYVTPQGAKTENLGYSHPQNFIRKNPDWLLNCEIYMPQKFPDIQYIPATMYYKVVTWLS